MSFVHSSFTTSLSSQGILLPLAIAIESDMLEMPMVNLELSNYLFGDLIDNVKNGYIDNFLKNAHGLGMRLTNEIKNKFVGVKNSGYRIK